jgi:hypothetical protein
MKNRSVAAWLMITFLSSIACLAQTPAILGSRGTPLGVNVGMTIRQAVEALKPEQQTYALSGDSGWYLAIHGRASNEILMTLWSDGSQDYVINYAAKVGAITLHRSTGRGRGYTSACY